MNSQDREHLANMIARNATGVHGLPIISWGFIDQLADYMAADTETCCIGFKGWLAHELGGEYCASCGLRRMPFDQEVWKARARGEK